MFKNKKKTTKEKFLTFEKNFLKKSFSKKINIMDNK
jgi:hypothetical protein